MNSSLLTIADSLTCERLKYYHALILSIATREYRMMILQQSSQGSPRQRSMDANHKHAVTSVTSANTGTFNYSYDESGNMIARNGDTMSYNTQGKLKEIKTTGGDVMEYLYESTGNRIRKRMKNAGVTVYSFDGLYDITRTKELESHTLYFKGLYGDTFAQMTRNDALLRADRDSAFDFIIIKNQLTQYSRHTILSVYGSVIDYRAMLVLATMFILLGYGLLLLNDSMTVLNFPIPLVLACYILLFSSCGNFKSDKKGEAPWLLLANGITDKTPSIDDVPATGSSAGASASSGSTLIAPTGMYFLHPDHLGSVSMITDGNGNVISGGNNGGKSSMNYKPYGEVNRTDSTGPDISKFKYTGQEEDKESGLLYYKARYYDPMLGRFLQADSVSDIDQSYGMNAYMYVDGNPVKFNDPSGHAKVTPMMVAVAMTFHRGAIESSGADFGTALLAGVYVAGGGNRSKIGRDMKGGAPAMLMASGLANGDPNAMKMASILFVGIWAGGGSKKIGDNGKGQTWFGHNYTGNGNRDPFSKLNSNNTESRTEARGKFLVMIGFLNQTQFKDNPISMEQAITFLAASKLFSPRPKSYSDEMAIGHDRDVPGKQFSGSRYDHMRADRNYLGAFVDGFKTGKIFRQPGDILIGLGGSFLFGLDYCLQSGLCALGLMK